MASAETFVLSGGAGVPAELVDQARAEARSVGYAQGWSQGIRAAAASQASAREALRTQQEQIGAESAAQVESALRALNTAASRMDESILQITDEISDRILAAAVELAQSLLGEQLKDPLVSARAALARVLRLTSDTEPVTIWLSPQDHQTLTGPDGPALMAAVDATAIGRITLECDPALAIGDATARSAATSIDARLTEAVHRLRQYTASEESR